MGNDLKFELKLDDGMVRYLMRAGKDVVQAKTKPETAEWIIAHGHATMTDDFPGYPLCVDDKWYIAAEIDGSGIEPKLSSKRGKRRLKDAVLEW